MSDFLTKPEPAREPLQASFSVAGRPAGKAQPGLVAGLARIAGQRIAVKATKACRASAAPLSSR